VPATRTTVTTCYATAPTGLLPVLSRPRQRARVLGRFRTAIYLDVTTDVVALLTRDAVRLPCGLVLTTHSDERPLDALTGVAMVGDGTVVVGDLLARVGRIVPVVTARLARPDAAVVRQATGLVTARGQPDIDPSMAAGLAEPDRAELTASRLVGRGSGLTPAGDDVLAGFLVAAYAYRLPAPAIRGLTTTGARTTRLSATLLRHAARGESVPQLAHFLTALGDGAELVAATDELLRIGHSSGTALAVGALVAARAAAR
jgi:hypothetical protein